MDAQDLLSAEERALLTAPKDEDPVDDAKTGADESPAGDTTASAVNGTTAQAEDAQAVQTDDDARPEPAAVFVPNFATEEVKDDRLAELRKEAVALRKRWSDGELDDEQYTAQAEKLDIERDEAVAAKIRAQLRNEISAETAQQSFAFQRNLFLKTVERVDGVPYQSNEIVRSAFDRELAKAGQRALENNPDATAEELFAEADKAVREQFAALGTTFGKKTAPATTTAAAAASAAKAPRNVPKTLAGLPAAAPVSTGDDQHLAQLATLEGEDYEIAVAKLSPDTRRRLLSQAD